MRDIVLADARARVAPFVGKDETRPYLLRPFGTKVGGTWRLGATDGHTAAVLACAEAEREIVQGAPPLENVADMSIRGAVPIGAVCAEALEPLRELPRKWQSVVTIGRGKCRLSAIWNTGAKRTRDHVVFARPGVETEWCLRLNADPRGIAVEYLLRAFDFFNLASVTVWSSPVDALAPVIFTASEDPILTQAALAIVMPVRT